MSEESTHAMNDEEIGLNFFTEGEPRTPDGLPSVFGAIDQTEMLARIDDVQEDDLASSFFSDSLIEVEAAATRAFDVRLRARGTSPEPVEPTVVESVAEAPVAAELEAVDDLVVEPMTVEPIVVEPVAVEPAPVEPIVVEPIVVEPIAVEQFVVEPVAVEPAPVEPIVVEPAPVEQFVVEPVAVERTAEHQVAEHQVVEPQAVERPRVEQPAVEGTVTAETNDGTSESADDEVELPAAAPLSRLGAAREDIVAMPSRTVITVPGILSKSAKARRSFILGGPAAVNKNEWE